MWKAIKPKDTANDKVFLVMGPWHHGQEIEDASTLGELHFGQDTGLYFRQHVLAPFLAHYLKDDPPADPHRDCVRDRREPAGSSFLLARRLRERAARIQPTPLYLEPNLGLVVR